MGGLIEVVPELHGTRIDALNFVQVVGICEVGCAQ